jgi:hypothetical protein
LLDLLLRRGIMAYQQLYEIIDSYNHLAHPYLDSVYQTRISKFLIINTMNIFHNSGRFFLDNFYWFFSHKISITKLVTDSNTTGSISSSPNSNSMKIFDLVIFG